MQIAAEAEAELKRRAAGQEAAAEPAQRAMPGAGYKRLFMSLIDPTAMARTEKCLEIVGRIGDHSAAAGREQGVCTASLLKGLYEDMSEMLDKPVSDGILRHALIAVGDALDCLHRFGRPYRDETPVEPRRYLFCTDEESAAWGGKSDLDPILALEKVGSKVAGLRDEASRTGGWGIEPEDVPLDPEFPPELIEPKRPPRTCRQALMRSEWELRQRFRKRGKDYIFPLRAKSIAGILIDCGVPGVS